jgi:hypothetical protein
MHLYCGNHAGRCLSPGKVCTVVPASGSRSSIGDRPIARHRNGRPPPHILTPRLESELRSGGWLAGWLGLPLGRHRGPPANGTRSSPCLPTWSRASSPAPSPRPSWPPAHHPRHLEVDPQNGPHRRAGRRLDRTRRPRHPALGSLPPSPSWDTCWGCWSSWERCQPRVNPARCGG